MLRQALNWLQQRVLQPATSAFGSSAKLWLPGLHADGVGWSD